MKKEKIRTIMAYLIPALVLLFFLAIMLSPLLFKGNKVTQQIELLSTDLDQENWSAAAKNHAVLEDEWRKTIKRIQFGENRDDINELSRNIIRLKGLIKVKDQASAISELIEADFRWQTLGV